MNFTKTAAIGAFLATSLLATSALAKGHAQGNTDNPGENVQTTVDAAQGLGAALREARGFARLSGKK